MSHPPESQPVVELRHITKYFPGIIACNDVSFSVNKGEIFALLGENGAGKSTLMSILFGLYEPDKGDIYIRGKKSIISSPNHAARLNIGMVHQHFKLVENQTVCENIILGKEPVTGRFGLFSHLDIKKAGKEITELSARYGLEVDPDKRIDEVPVSTRQKVEILKMLYRNAEILIFDEPTAVLTPQEIDALLSIIRNLRNGGKTIILISHKLEEIKQVADRCVILRKGCLTGIMDVRSTSTREMASKMVGREVLFTVKKNEHDFGREVLKVENLSVRRDDGVQAVRNVSFSVREGEIFAVAGVAGNGQGEIAEAIAGLIPCSGGTVTLDGRSVNGLSIRERIEAGISFIPEDRQDMGLLLDNSLAENLSLKTYYKAPFSRRGILNKPLFISEAEKLIDKYDIRSAEGCATTVRTMSGGNQQKAVIAREIELDSRLLVFVQPTRGLDIGAIETIHSEIIAQRDKGKAVLLISLELDEIMALADSIGVIYNGEFRHVSPAADLTTEKVGEYMMGVL